MIISIKKEDILIYFGKMLPEVNVEEILVLNYDMNRESGINYVDMLGKNFLSNMFNTTAMNIDSFFSPGVLVTKTYKILDMIDMMLLSHIEDFNFKNIKFNNVTNHEYQFEVIYD